VLTAPLKLVAMQTDQFTHRMADAAHRVSDAVQRPGPILPGALLPGAWVPAGLIPGRHRALKQLLGGLFPRLLTPR
jgi:hypothetical protein